MFLESTSSICPTEYRKFCLVKKDAISHNVRLFRFALPTPTSVLGLPIGKHIYLQAQVGEDIIARPYTPTSSDDDLGHFDLIIKVYPAGKMTQHLDHLAIGEYVRVKGPLGKFTYNGRGWYSISAGEEARIKSIGMLAGGTGITPMLQIVRAVMKDNQDSTKISLVFGNLSENDILLRQELDEYEHENPDRFSCYHTLNEAPEGWEQGVGFVTADIISQRIPPPSSDTIVLLCGPAPFINAMNSILLGMSYTKEMIFKF